jgi:ribonucleotide reductase beta subunit family protein with ferritin-like domain
MEHQAKDTGYNNILMKNEPLLQETNTRFTMFPIEHEDIWNMYKKAQDCFWRAEEIDFSKDLDDWEKLSGDEQYFIKMILAFFSSSDGVVIENLNSRFSTEIQSSEARAFYGFQTAMENVHSETYSLLIDSYIKNSEEKHDLFNSIDKFKCIQKKAKWAIKWIEDDNSSFLTRLVAFACVEGIFFSGSFCSIYWLGKRGLMPGLVVSNEFISRDEAMHTDFAVLIYNKMNNKLTEEQIHNIIGEAVSIEQEFICEALPCSLIGMNSKMMNQYIEFVADRLISQLGYNKKYGSENPFSFMEMISLEGKSNMFEKRVTDYSLSTQDKKEDIFGDDIDF